MVLVSGSIIIYLLADIRNQAKNIKRELQESNDREKTKELRVRR